MGIQGRIMEFIRELFDERWIKVRVRGTGRLGSFTARGAQWILFLVSINGILGNGVDGSLFADDIAIYITRKSQ